MKRTLLSVLGATGCMLALSLSTAGSAAAAFGFVTKWGATGTGAGDFRSPFGIDAGENDNIYVSECIGNRIQKFSPTGTYITGWGSGGTGLTELSCPYQVAYAPFTNNVYVADSGNNLVKVFTPTGVIVDTIGSGNAGPDDGDLNGPNGVAVDGVGNVYVAEQGNKRISKFDADFNFVTKWGALGSGDGEFDQPRGVEIGPDGNVWVADYANDRVQVFTPTGTFVRKFGSTGSAAGQFVSVTDTAFGKDGVVYASDDGNTRVNIFSASLSPLGSFGNGGSNDGEFSNSPQFITTDSACNVYVADYGNDRVQKFGDTAAPGCTTVPDGGGGSAGTSGGAGVSVIPDLTAPRMTAVGLSRTRFRVDPAGAVIALAPKGTVIRFTLSEAATVAIRVERRTQGRRVAGKCRRQTTSNRRKPRCVRYVLVKRFTRSRASGRNSVAFSGRYRKNSKARKLTPGRYRFTMQARDAARNRSALVRRAFRVVRR